jgi:hypothetical protein
MGFLRLFSVLAAVTLSLGDNNFDCKDAPAPPSEKDLLLGLFPLSGSHFLSFFTHSVSL